MNLKFNLTSGFKISRNYFKNSHEAYDCKGKWKILKKDVILNLPEIGFINLTNAPFIQCEKCSAKAMLPGLEQFILSQICFNMLVSEKNFSKKSLRFLRKYFGLTQVEVAASILQYKDVKQYTHIESDASEKVLPVDKAILLKIAYFSKLNPPPRVMAEFVTHVFKVNEGTEEISVGSSIDTKKFLGSDYEHIITRTRESLAA